MPTIRELMAVESHDPVKRKVGAVLCWWSTNFAPASILPSSISTTLIEQTALKLDPCSRACNWNGRSACLHVYVVHVAVKAVWCYLALRAVASSFFLGKLRLFSLYSILLRPLVDKRTLLSRASLDCRSTYLQGFVSLECP